MNKNSKARIAEKAMKEAVSIAMDRYKKLGVNAAYSKKGELYYMTPEGKELKVINK